MGIIYIAINKHNNKKYIGQTTRNIDDRKLEHKVTAFYKRDGLYVYSSPFYKAIRKYGFDAFEWHILYDNVKKIKLDEKEVFAIKKFNTYVGRSGYNATFGGKDSPMNHTFNARKMAKSKKGKCVGEETRKKMSEAKSGSKNPFFGRKHSDNTKKKISEANGGENSAWYGKKHSKKTRIKISLAQSGKKLSQETKDKISEAMSGKTRFVSSKTKIKMSLAQSGANHPMWGKKHSEDTRAKMSKTRKGKFKKLNKSQIEEIKSMYKNNGYSYKELSDIYSVSKSTIMRAIKN